MASMNYTGTALYVCDTVVYPRRIEGTVEVKPPPKPPEPVVYLAGRNDPCPCKSGKKYKRCCRPQ